MAAARRTGADASRRPARSATSGTPAFGASANAGSRTAASPCRSSGARKAAGSTSPASDAARSAIGSCEAGRPFDSTIRFNAARAGPQSRRASAPRTARCSTRGSPTPKPANRRHSRSSAGTASPRERDTTAAQSRSTFAGVACGSIAIGSPSVKSAAAAPVCGAAGVVERFTSTRPRSSKRSGCPSTAARPRRTRLDMSPILPTAGRPGIPAPRPPPALTAPVPMRRREREPGRDGGGGRPGEGRARC